MTQKKGYKKFLKSMKQNYWISATLIMAILLIFSFFSNSCTGLVVSPEIAGAAVLQFALDQGADAEILSTTDTGSLYEVVLSIQGQEVPVYVTRDGKKPSPANHPFRNSNNTNSNFNTNPNISKPNI